LPTLARLLHQERFQLSRMPVGLPTSTPAFQAALMYGGPVDIPAFEFLDKRTREYHWFPQPWTSAHVEDIHANEDCGIMRGGRTYGCVFTGGAADCVMTFAHLLGPSRGWWTLAPRNMLASLALVPQVSAKLGVTILAEALGGAKRTPLPLPFKKRLLIRWLRELSTAGVRMDVRAGLPAVYVDFVGYDEVAHPLGPTHPATLRELRRIDRSIRAIWRAVRGVPGSGMTSSSCPIMDRHPRCRSRKRVAVRARRPPSSARSASNRTLTRQDRAPGSGRATSASSRPGRT
jgi:hypothetical protein